MASAYNNISDVFGSLVFLMRLCGIDISNNLASSVNKIRDTTGVQSSHSTTLLVSGPASSMDTQTPSQGIPAHGFQRHGFKKYFFRVSGFLVVAVTWASLLQTVLSFWLDSRTEEGIFVLRITSTLWLLQCAANGTVLYRIGFSGWLSTLCESLEDFHLAAMALNVCDDKTIPRLYQSIRRNIRAFVISQGLLAALFFFSYYFVSEVKYMFDKMAFPFIPSSSSWVLCPLLLTINNTCWILGYELVCILTITLRHLFHQLAVGIADHRLHNERFVSRLGDYSNLYVDLSRVTCLVDRYLRVIMAVAVFINSVIAVFVNYIILKLNLKVWVICVVSAWFSVCAIVFLATSVLCSRVESKVTTGGIFSCLWMFASLFLRVCVYFSVCVCVRAPV